ncbi:MAG: anti-sigma factor family protein [Gemmataceae bacterium]
MTCQEIQPLLYGYGDGELDLVRNLEIERHLQECAGCSKALERHQALRTTLTDPSIYHPAPAHLRERVRLSLRRQGKSPATFRATRWVGIAASVAFFAILGGTLAWALSKRPAEEMLAQEVISDHVRSLMANHLVDVPSSNQHKVKPWFNGLVNFSPEVKNLESKGFPLVGGRLDYLNNRTVAALVYKRREHVINVFLWPSATAEDSAPHVMQRQTYHLIHWNNAGLAHWVISDLNEPELQEFVQLFRE